MQVEERDVWKGDMSFLYLMLPVQGSILQAERFQRFMDSVARGRGRGGGGSGRGGGGASAQKKKKLNCCLNDRCSSAALYILSLDLFLYSSPLFFSCSLSFVIICSLLLHCLFRFFFLILSTQLSPFLPPILSISRSHLPTHPPPTPPLRDIRAIVKRIV